VLQVLQQFDQLLQHLDDNGADAWRRPAPGDHAFFAGSARQHHADEERWSSPACWPAATPNWCSTCKRLQQDHGWLEEDWLELAPQIEAIAQGYSWYDLAMLRHALPVFTALYHEHIALEESLIYPARAKRRAGRCCAAGAPRAPRGAYTGSAVVFFTVRSTSIELLRTTPGRRGSTSAWKRSRSSASR
jgi:hypothetical protein